MISVSGTEERPLKTIMTIAPISMRDEQINQYRHPGGNSSDV